MVIKIAPPEVTHDCYLPIPREVPRVYPWYNYHIKRKVWEGEVEWEFVVLDLEVIFCPVCGINLEEAYQMELAKSL